MRTLNVFKIYVYIFLSADDDDIISYQIICNLV